ncbi:MAG: MmcQ/YjbR family DNA-binding protein [Thermoplasmatota archaeon]
MLDLQEIREYCLSKKGTSEDFPFDLETLTIRVGNRMFLLTNIRSEELRINHKCDPLLAIDLRDEFPAVTPGYHMNTVLWNTVMIDGSIPDERILRMIDHSYDLVFNKLKRSERERLSSL